MTKYFEDETFAEQDQLPLFSQGTDFVCCTFNGLDMSELSVRSVRFIECTFNKCNLSNISVTNASFRDVEFSNSKLLGINWSPAQAFYDLKFKQSILDFCTFDNSDILNSVFKECSMRNVEFTESNLKGSRFDSCDLSESVFHHANVENCDFREATNYYIDITNNRVKNARFSMPEAISLLAPLGVIID